MAERSKALESGYFLIQSERAWVRIPLLSNSFSSGSLVGAPVHLLTCVAGWVRLRVLSTCPHVRSEIQVVPGETMGQCERGKNIPFLLTLLKLNLERPHHDRVNETAI